MAINVASGTIIIKSQKAQDGIYSDKRMVGNSGFSGPAINAPTQKFYHSSKNYSGSYGFFNEEFSGKLYNKIYDDDLYDGCVFLGQDDIVDSISYDADTFNVFRDDDQYGVITSSNKYFYNRFSLENNSIIETYPIRYDDYIGFPFFARGTKGEGMLGLSDGDDIVYTHVDSNRTMEAKERGFYKDAYYYGTASINKYGHIFEEYVPGGEAELVGFFNDGYKNYIYTSSTIYPIIGNAMMQESSSLGTRTFNKTRAQKILLSKTSSSPFNSVKMYTVGNDYNLIGLDELEILHQKYNWHFVSSKSRDRGDCNIISNDAGKQEWTYRNSPFDSMQRIESDYNLLPPIRRKYSYDIRDYDNVNNYIDTSVYGSTGYKTKHCGYKKSAADRVVWDVGVDSLTTTDNQQLISTAINEVVGDELCERNIYKFFESLKTIKFLVSSSLTPSIVNEVRVGCSPLQPVRPYEMVKFPSCSFAFGDYSRVPIGPYDMHNIEPNVGNEIFEPNRTQLPRMFVPEHYITGTLGGATKDNDNTTYNSAWAAAPEGGKVISHWQPHNVSFTAGSSNIRATSSFLNAPGAYNDNLISGDALFPSIKSMSEINDYWFRNNQKYSVVHKQTYNPISGSGLALTSSLDNVYVGHKTPSDAGKINVGALSAYTFTMSIDFYSCSSGVVAASKSFGPYYSQPEFIYNAAGRLANVDLPDGYFGQVPTGLDQNSNYIWSFGHSSSYDVDSYGYYRRISSVVYDNFSEFNLSTASIKVEAILLTSSSDIVRDVSLLDYNTSSVRFDFDDVFSDNNFLKNSLDRRTNNIGYKNLYNNLVDKSNFDNSPSPFRTSLLNYSVATRGTIEIFVLGITASVDGPAINNAFVYDTVRGRTSGLSDNFGNTDNFPNAAIVPGIRPYREDKNLFDSKDDLLTMGSVRWQNSSMRHFMGGSTWEFDPGDDIESYAKTKYEYDPANDALCEISDDNTNNRNFFGVGLEGFYGFKNYIVNEGVLHNSNFYDTILDLSSNDYPTWNDDEFTIYQYTKFYGLTDAEIDQLVDVANANNEDFFSVITHDISDYYNLTFYKRIPPDEYSNMFYSVYLQYPKSYVTASSVINAVTYSFDRSGPEDSSLFNRFSLDGINDFNSKPVNLLLMSESRDAASELLTDDKNCIYFRNEKSNFVFVQDSGSVSSALEDNASCVMPQSTYANLLTNSFGDISVRSSLTDKRLYNANTMSMTPLDSDPIGTGVGRDWNINNRAPWLINKAQIGYQLTSSVVSEYGVENKIVESGEPNYDAAIGTKGYFKTKYHDNISSGVTGSITRRVIENSFADLSLAKQFDWVAESPMVASQINTWAGSARIIATASSNLNYVTSSNGHVYPSRGAGDVFVKTDAFVNIPVINASFAKAIIDNGAYTPGLNGDVSSTKGQHLSASLLYDKTGSFVVGYKNSDQLFGNVFLRKFKLKQYEKTSNGYGDEDYIRKVNQKFYHDLGNTYLSDDYSCPDYPSSIDAPYMLNSASGDFNYVLYDYSNVLIDSKRAGNNVFELANDVHNISSSLYYQNRERIVFYPFSYGQFRHILEPRITTKTWQNDKEYIVYVQTGNISFEQTASSPYFDIIDK
jgi:hypothetical protein